MLVIASVTKAVMVENINHEAGKQCVFWTGISEVESARKQIKFTPCRCGTLTTKLYFHIRFQLGNDTFLLHCTQKIITRKPNFINPGAEYYCVSAEF